MRTIKVENVMSCDRCNASITTSGEQPKGWLYVTACLSESPDAEIEYDLCQGCRESVSMWLAGVKYDSERRLIERLADILYPMNEFADTQWNGADVCDMLAAVLDEVAPWARSRQAEDSEGLYDAMMRERARLGL